VRPDPAADLDAHAALDRIAAGLAGDGHAIVPDFIDAGLVRRLRERARSLDAAGAFADARVGRGASSVRRADIRGDRIRWLDEGDADAAERDLRDALEPVRAAANRALALGAFDVELHYAVYPPGAGYARHVDAFRDDDARVLSCVVYLNEDWRATDGGALRLWRADGSALEVEPRGGTLAVFLAGRVEHEVLPALRERWSVTGWFRRRSIAGSIGGSIRR
jgi:SM-20-related protein